MSIELKKQKLLLEYLISNPDTFILCYPIINSEYFDAELRNAVKFIQNYYDKYSAIPKTDQIEVESGVRLTNKRLADRDEILYCAEEIEHFCKQQALWKAIINAPELMKKNEPDAIEQSIKDALMVSLHKDMGIRYYESVKDRLERLTLAPPLISTGWSEFDRVLDGGLCRQELILFAANSGGGKSISLNNLAANFAEMKRNILYITLELSQDAVAGRFDTMYTGYSRGNWRDNKDEIVYKVGEAGKDAGNLDLVFMPLGTRPKDMKAFMKEYILRYGISPDLLIADYLGKMEPNTRIKDNINERDKAISSQFRELGVEFNCVTASATQLNRTAVNKEVHDHSMVAGGYSQIQECDWFVTVLLDPIRKAKGIVDYQFGKTRSSEGTEPTATLAWDNKYMRIRDLPANKNIINKTNNKPTNTPQTNNKTNQNEFANMLTYE